MKGQASIEFVVIAAFMILFFIVMTIAVQNQIVQAKQLRDEAKLEELYAVINNELLLAQAVNNGYSHYFYLPSTINDRGYQALIQDQNWVLNITYKGRAYLYFLDDNTTLITPLEPGLNVIKKP